CVGRQMLDDAKFKSKMLGEPEIFGIDALSDSAIVIQGRLKTKPIRQWDVGREFLRRIKLAFEANDIEIPFPQQAVHYTTDQNALPLQLLAGDAALRRDQGDEPGAHAGDIAEAPRASRKPAASQAKPEPTPPGEVPAIVQPPEPPPQVQ